MRWRDAVAALKGRTTNRHLDLFKEFWPAGPVSVRDIQRAGASPVCILAGHHANTIATNAAEKKLPLILEIGAGSGYLTYFLLTIYEGSIAFVVDLPETLTYSAANLEHLGVGHRVNLVRAERASFSVPKFDIAANTASFQEMMPETIEGYFSLLRAKAQPGAVFYCCNRVEKWLSTEVGNSDAPQAKQDIPVRFAEYPWGSEQDVFYRVSQMHRRLAMQPCQERMIRF